MKFAHLADCHLDGWREPKMKDLGLQAFSQAIAQCISAQVDFILIAGDLFNTAMPGIETLKCAVTQLELLRQSDIPVYIIPGSHDVTHAGRSMIDVLEEAKLVTNVVRGTVVDGRLRLLFTIDKKTGVKITGMLGRRGMLEKEYYEQLDADALEEESGEKIFMFHTAIDELKTSQQERTISSPLSLLPRGFLYYAGGHVHEVAHETLPGYKHIVYPGPLFPNSFSELEHLKQGGFFIYDNGNVQRVQIPLKRVVLINSNAEHASPAQVTADIKEQLSDVADAIVLLRVAGRLSSGKVSDVDFNALTRMAVQNGAYVLLRNTAKLSSETFEEFKKDYTSAEDIEHAFFKEHLGQVKNGLSPEQELDLAKRLLHALDTPRGEGERVFEYEEKIRIAGKELMASTLSSSSGRESHL